MRRALRRVGTASVRRLVLLLALLAAGCALAHVARPDGLAVDALVVWPGRVSACRHGDSDASSPGGANLGCVVVEGGSASTAAAVGVVMGALGVLGAAAVRYAF